MRIPIPIVILCCVVTLGIVWFLGTRNVDFVTPPTPEKLTQVATEWEKSRPNIPPPQPANAALFTDKTTTQQVSPITPTAPRPESLPLGDLNQSPGLSAYRAHSDTSAEMMIKLATLLETKGELQRALLAWERVIDTTNPSEEERSLAANSIKRLKHSLPPWNPDSKSDILITLRAGATLQEKALLTNSLKKVAATINQSSGYTLRVETKASIGKVNRGTRPPRMPIAIWFSRQLANSENTAETPPISFMADPTQEQLLVSQIEAGIYALVRAHLGNTAGLSPLPEYPQGAKPSELLQLHITRLMWREFATSLKE